MFAASQMPSPTVFGSAAAEQSWSFLAATRASSVLRQAMCCRSQPPLVHRPSVQQKSDHFEPGRPWGQYCCSVEQDQPLQAVASAGYLAGAMDSASAQTSAMASEPSGTWIWYSTRTASAPWFWDWSRRRDDGSLRMTVMSSKSGTQAPAVHVPDPASSKMQQ